MLTATTTTTIHTRRRCDQIYIWSELDLYLPQDRILYDRERKKNIYKTKKSRFDEVINATIVFECRRRRKVCWPKTSWLLLLLPHQLHTQFCQKKYSTTIRIWRLPALGGVPIFKPRLITNCEREEAANGNYYFANWEKKGPVDSCWNSGQCRLREKLTRTTSLTLTPSLSGWIEAAVPPLDGKNYVRQEFR